jgi:acyl-coenzyme A synthetase/AMP-(fatty) acid ligase
MLVLKSAPVLTLTIIYSIGTFKLLHYPLLCGVPAVIQSGFDPEKFCASIEKYKVTIALAVPPVLVVLARHPGQFCSIVLYSLLRNHDSGRQI